MGIPLLRGRGFHRADTGEALPVAIVNQALANRSFPDEDPIGKHIRALNEPATERSWLTIVGIVGDEKQAGPFQEMGWIDPPTVYRPLARRPASAVSVLMRPETMPGIADVGYARSPSR